MLSGASLRQNFGSKALASSGRKDPSCQLQRLFLGHFLSAATILYAEGTDDMVAFSYGPIVLAGLCNAERLLHTKSAAPETLLVHDCERECGMWKMTFKTRGQDPGIRFVPLYQIGYERYQVYFPIID